MAAEEPHQGGLQSLGVEVFKIFQKLIEQPWISDELTVLPSRRSIESEEERFRLWTQSMGLMQVGHASLDYRVRDSSVIKSSLTDVLSELLDHLENLMSIILGSRLPAERDRTIGKDGSIASDESDDETSVSSFGSNSFHEADFRLSSVVERLDALYKLAARIRNPRNRPQRPTRDLYKHIPEGGRAQYRENQEQIETALVAFVQQRHLLESVTEEQLQNLDTSRGDLLEQYASGTYWLIRKIGLANARRKQQFVYWEGHAQLLARDVAMKAPIIRKLDPATTIAGAEVPVAGHVEQPASSVATSATRLISEITGPDDLSLHQTHDLQPYQCTYKDCPDANRLYSQRQEWIDHENQHRRVWHCHAHGEEFETQPEFHRHIADKHPEEDLSLEVKATFVGSSVRPHRDCPFCPTVFTDVEHMQSHITYHLERLALFALPDADERNRDEALSGHYEDSNRVVEHRGRRYSIDGDFSQEENFGFAAFRRLGKPGSSHSLPITAQAIRDLTLLWDPDGTELFHTAAIH
ncbi:hypothetical protein CSOJ01_14597 [Colletotrichum sojae]|uniref:C2H2-type domain-containing protein n=1 Tax=Colletotrichum sojae TaxID=2175907 RepID=A0A8H6IPH4_9PEZI|nr:hypothetical protein CSOJ01_14597 [Colletotrichum sojae]